MRADEMHICARLWRAPPDPSAPWKSCPPVPSSRVPPATPQLHGRAVHRALAAASHLRPLSSTEELSTAPAALFFAALPLMGRLLPLACRRCSPTPRRSHVAASSPAAAPPPSARARASRSSAAGSRPSRGWMPSPRCCCGCRRCCSARWGACGTRCAAAAAGSVERVLCLTRSS
eukprot:717357-Prymnesium_polylepis.1